ncbi:MAG TPA: hypothetical protein VIY66_15080 [Candidatus Acidoferrales bacterium]
MKEAALGRGRGWKWWASSIFLAVMWSIPAYFLLQIVLLWRLRGGWRKAVAVPVLPMLALLAYAVFAYLKGSNLFPLVLIFTAPLAFVYLLVILGGKTPGPKTRVNHTLRIHAGDQASETR